MQTEVMWNNSVYYVEAGNYYQSCIKVLQDYLRDLPAEAEIHTEPFLVTNLANGDSCPINMEVVVAIMQASNEYDPNEPEPALNNNSDLAFETNML